MTTSNIPKNQLFANLPAQVKLNLLPFFQLRTLGKKSPHHICSAVLKDINRNGFEIRKPQPYHKHDAISEMWQLPEELRANLTPVKYKRPYHQNWQTYPKSPSDIQNELLANRANGYGFVLKQEDDFLVLDCDGLLALKPLLYIFRTLDNVPETVSMTSGKNGKFSLILKVSPQLKEFLQERSNVSVIKAGSGHQLEIRFAGCQSVLPPSLHPDTGFAYQWGSHPSNCSIKQLTEGQEQNLKQLLYKEDEKKRGSNKKNDNVRDRASYRNTKTNSDQYYDLASQALFNAVQRLEENLPLSQKYDLSQFRSKGQNSNWLVGKCPSGNHPNSSGTAFQVDTITHQFHCHGCNQGGNFIHKDALSQFGNTNEARGKFFLERVRHYANLAGLNWDNLITDETLKFYQFNPDKVVEERFISDCHNTIKDIKGNVALKAGYKKGKTRWIINHYVSKGYRVIYICCRNSVTRNFQEQEPLLVQHINDGYNDFSYTANLDSVHKIPFNQMQGAIVVFDEAEAILNHLTVGGTEIKNRRREIVNFLRETINEIDKLYLLDANLGDLTVKRFEDLLDTKFTKVENINKEKLSSVTRINHKDVYRGVKHSLKQNQNIVILVDSIKEGYKFKRKYGEHYGKNVFYACSETINEHHPFYQDPTRYIYENQIQVLIATTTIHIGFSIENFDYFDCVYGSFPYGNLSAKDINQFLFRIRDFNVPRYVHVGDRKLTHDKDQKDALKFEIQQNQRLTDKEKQVIFQNIDIQLESKLTKSLLHTYEMDELESWKYKEVVFGLLDEYVDGDIVNFEQTRLSKEKVEDETTNEEIKDELLHEEAERIVKADDSNWENLSNSQFYNADDNKKDESWKNQHYKRKFKNIENSGFWQPNHIAQLEDNLDKKVGRYYNLQYFDQHEEKEAERYKKQFSRSKFYNDVFNLDDLILRVLMECGFDKVLEQGYFAPQNDTARDTPTLNFLQKLHRHKWKHKIPKVEESHVVVKFITEIAHEYFGLDLARSQRTFTFTDDDGNSYKKRCQVYLFKESNLWRFCYLHRKLKDKVKQASQFSDNNTDIKEASKIVTPLQKIEQQNNNEMKWLDNNEMKWLDLPKDALHRRFEGNVAESQSNNDTGQQPQSTVSETESETFNSSLNNEQILRRFGLNQQQIISLIYDKEPNPPFFGIGRLGTHEAMLYRFVLDKNGEIIQVKGNKHRSYMMGEPLKEFYNSANETLPQNCPF